jgi:uncharacterized membrane protein YidH (DUF202 family)
VRWLRATEAPPTDPGLARERTSLAWTRTAIGFAAIGAALLHKYVAVGVAVLVLSGIVQTCGRLGRPGGPGQARPWPLLIIALAVTGIALAALAIAVFGPPSSGVRL